MLDAGQDQDAGARLRQRVADSIAALLTRMLRRDAPVDEGSRLMDELGLSSSLALELLLEVEDELDIQIDVEELDQDEMRTVGDLADYIVANSAPR